MGRLLYVLSVGLIITTLNVACYCRAEEVPFSQQYAALTPVDRGPDKTDEQAIRELIEQYRLGYQRTDTETLAKVFRDFTPALRAALVKYHQNAQDLTVHIEGVRVLYIDQNEAIAVFTRRDQFIDAQTGKSVHAQTQLMKKFIQQDGAWKMLATAELY